MHVPPGRRVEEKVTGVGGIWDDQWVSRVWPQVTYFTVTVLTSVITEIQELVGDSEAHNAHQKKVLFAPGTCSALVQLPLFFNYMAATASQQEHPLHLC